MHLEDLLCMKRHFEHDVRRSTVDSAPNHCDDTLWGPPQPIKMAGSGVCRVGQETVRFERDGVDGLDGLKG